jgi:7-cyano-7-deazaguanine synthase
MEKVVLILSGGMDSTTLLYDLVEQGKEVHPLSFYYGQKHNREIGCAVWHCKQLDLQWKGINIDWLGQLGGSALTDNKQAVPEGHYAAENMKQTVVPNRNMIFLSIATAYAISKNIRYVYYGAHSGDHEIYPDCRPEFVKYMRQAVKCADWKKVKLEAPYLFIDKGDILKKGLVLNVPYEHTQTCYKGGEAACGKCGSCSERLEAFAKNGAKDPAKY